MSESAGSACEVSQGELVEFAGEKREIIDENPQMNEEETKAAIVTGFVDLLGWGIPGDGSMEYRFGDHNTNVVDYAFFHNGASKLFVEAKSQGTALQEKHQNQLREYLVLDNVDLGILTNGRVYEFYRRFVNDEGDVETRQIERVSLSEFSEYAELINIFSKPQVTDDTYSERLRRINNIRTAREALEENQEEIANSILEVIRDSVGKIAEQPAADHTTDFLQAVDDDLAAMTPTGSTGDKTTVGDVDSRETGVESRSENSTAEDSASTGSIEEHLAMADGDTIVDGDTREPVFPLTDRTRISAAGSAKVGVYASDFDRGLPFILKNNGWGFIDIASEPEYFCIYITRPYQQLQLIGEVREVVSKTEFLQDRDPDRDTAGIADTKKAIEFGDVYQFEEPIPLGDRTSRMQGLLYTSIGDLQTADTTDDL